MRNEAMEQDTELGALLRDACGTPPLDDVDWPALQRTITARAEPVLAGRRVRPRRARFYVPASLAASLALLVVLGRGTGGPDDDVVTDSTGTAGVTIEEMFDADVSDGQFRALLAGAAELEDLLLIAASGGTVQ